MARVGAVAVAAGALAGCTFGDEGAAQEVQPGLGNWFNENCTPVECLRECCQGWNYSEYPLLHGGQVLRSQCAKFRTDPEYAEYDDLMDRRLNRCIKDFAYLESGHCTVIYPPAVYKSIKPDGTPVYAGLNFLVCPPRGQYTSDPALDVELTPQE
jgi:hypothetical protein